MSRLAGIMPVCHHGRFTHNNDLYLTLVTVLWTSGCGRGGGGGAIRSATLKAWTNDPEMLVQYIACSGHVVDHLLLFCIGLCVSRNRNI